MVDQTVPLFSCARFFSIRYVYVNRVLLRAYKFSVFPGDSTLRITRLRFGRHVSLVAFYQPDIFVKLWYSLGKFYKMTVLFGESFLVWAKGRSTSIYICIIVWGCRRVWWTLDMHLYRCVCGSIVTYRIILLCWGIWWESDGFFVYVEAYV